MQAPNVISMAIIVAIIAGLEVLGTKLPTLQEPWVPVVVIVIAAIVKALQVYIQQPQDKYARIMAGQSRLRRWLVG